MNFYTLPPTQKLKGLVRFFWVFEGNSLTEPYIYRSMGDSCSELIFHYKGRFDELSESGDRIPSFLSGIHSQTSKYRRFITDHSFGIFGVYLYPFTAVHLLNLSPAELTNQMPDLCSAIGRKGKNLEEQIILAPDNQSRYQILSSFLENQLCNSFSNHHPVLSAVRYVIHSGKVHTVKELSDTFNLSERQFERKFKEYSGFTPKKYMRIVRFSDTCDYYQHSDEKSLTEIAHECGYFDQSHFIKEFKSFSGYAPSEFFSGRAEGIEWRERLQVAGSR